jgi:starch phosphorylase
VEVERRTGQRLDPEAMTVGFARRAATYKRTDLLFSDPERLRRIAREVGPLQFIYAGKAHPHDEGGKAMIRRVFEAKQVLGSEVPIVYLEDYDMILARSLCAGVDLWLNTPQKPQEASGTSGMKAALNGVPSLSVLDGWWIEGCVEGVTGWSIGDRWEEEADSHKEVASMYEKLESVIVPMFYGKPLAFARVMRSAIALNGSFFNAQRMLLQYMQNAYRASESSENQQDRVAAPRARRRREARHGRRRCSCADTHCQGRSRSGPWRRVPAGSDRAPWHRRTAPAPPPGRPVRAPRQKVR